jgi:hypothetical protein
MHPFDREIREIYRSGHLDTSDWNAVCAITLTLKQVIWSNGFLIPLDQWQCSRALNHFMNLLNRKVYRNAFYRHGKRLRVTPILERGICGAFHWHLSLERPGRISEFRFRFLVDQAWSETHWGDDRMSLVRSQSRPPFFLPFSPNRMRLVPTCGTPSTQSTASPEGGTGLVAGIGKSMASRGRQTAKSILQAKMRISAASLSRERRRLS